MMSRLTKEMVKVIQAAAINARGLRNVIDGEAELLEGFKFNIEAQLSTSFYAPYTYSMDRATGIVSLQIPSFIPAHMIAAPSGATHYQLTVAAAEIDFEQQRFTLDSDNGTSLPWDAAPTAALAISRT